MDILDDIFKQADLKRKILNQRSMYEPGTFKFPCNRSIGFHIVTQGETYLHLDNEKEPVLLKRGDIAVMARGFNHYLSSEPRLKEKDFKAALGIDHSNEIKLHKKNAIPKATVISGAYQLWNDPLHPFFKELPDIFLLRNDEIESFGQIQLALTLLSKEAAEPQMGSERVIQNLLDIVFSFIIRKIVHSKSSKPKTWSQALQNEAVKKAIELLHTQVEKDWTLEDLAKTVGLSRAGLAQKFKKYLGDTPLHYLTVLRMQKARALLSSTNDNIESIAEAVGYSDAFSFSKVFKRITGVPPRDFRTRDQSDRHLPYRY
jgi:AraC-like DNA-binding protein